MSRENLLRPRTLLLALCIGAAAGACTINVDPTDDEAGDDADACHEDCEQVHVDCSASCNDGDDACVGTCDADLDECEQDC